MKNIGKELDGLIDNLEKLGVVRNDGEKITREDAVKLLGPYTTTFTEIEAVTKESQKKIEGIVLRFVSKLNEFELSMKAPD